MCFQASLLPLSGRIPEDLSLFLGSEGPQLCLPLPAQAQGMVRCMGPDSPLYGNWVGLARLWGIFQSPGRGKGLPPPASALLSAMGPVPQSPGSLEHLALSSSDHCRQSESPSFSLWEVRQAKAS